MPSRHLPAVAAVLLLAACAAAPVVHTDPCNVETAYEAGYNDAREDRAMAGAAFAATCAEERRIAVQASYREGYLAGEAARAAAASAVVAPHPGPRGFFCEVSPRGNPYSALGRSNDEARIKVIALCEQKEDPFFCKNPRCRPAE